MARTMKLPRTPLLSSLVLASVGLAGLAGAAPALAQTTTGNLVVPNLPLEYDRGRNVGVLDRARPEYDATGILMGGFILHPKAELGAVSSDNVYQTTVKRGDIALRVAPSATLASNWNRNSLQFDGGVDVRRYMSATRRNVTGWNLGTSGRYDISGDSSINASLSAQQSAEPATSASYPSAAAEASIYQAYRASVNPTFATGRLKFQGGYSFTAVSFDSVQTLSGGTLDQRFRNSQTHSGSLRAEYAISPDTSVFVQGGYDDTSYLHPISAVIPNRDSKTFTILGGASFDISARVRGAFGLGYTQRDYQAALYPQVSGLAAELKVDWFPDALTTVGVTGRRIVQDSVQPALGGLVNNSIGVRVDHEFLRNVLIDVQGAYEYDQFQNSSTSVDILRLSTGARWIVNRGLGFGVSLQRDSRTPHGFAGVSQFTETRGVLTMVLQK